MQSVGRAAQMQAMRLRCRTESVDKQRCWHRFGPDVWILRNYEIINRLWRLYPGNDFNLGKAGN